ncbi:hypothetical protein F5146DRAFT_1006523 [Armillaria mellea]|nr:hypothetical protein F5146DRAFT_1006523 [Armillaria mellea]
MPRPRINQNGRWTTNFLTALAATTLQLHPTEQSKYGCLTINSKRVDIPIPMCLAEKIKNDIDASLMGDFECFCCKVMCLVVDCVSGTVGDGEGLVDLYYGDGDDVLPGGRILSNYSVLHPISRTWH